VQKAIQDYFPKSLCWGCGQINEKGLKIRSYYSPQESVCTFEPEAHHAAGPPHVVNGGLIATLIDCHAVCTAIANAYGAEGRAMDSEPAIWYVTAMLKVDYLLPALMDRAIHLKARVRDVEGKKTWVDCAVYSGDVECARGELLAVRVTDSWTSPQPTP
jgi:acyl-coenzyme A thioesterase PaaI-like protein